MAFPDDWTYYKQTTIAHPDGEITNHQIDVIVAESAAAVSQQTTKFPTLCQKASYAPYNSGDDWGSETNIKTDDNSYASVTASSFDTNRYTTVLKGSLFRVNVPRGAIITGIEVSIGKYCSAGAAKDALVQLTKDGSTCVGDNYASADAWPGSETAVMYGGPTDLWGTTWTVAEINAATFGLHFAAQATANDTDIYVDYFKITVYWSAPFCLEEHGNSDFSDVRFTDSSDNLYNYYLKSVSGTTPNQIAQFVVKIPIIAVDASILKCWYGNADAVSASSITDAYTAADDFEWGANNDNLSGGTNIEWTTVGAVVISTTKAFSGTRSVKIPYASSPKCSMSCALTASDNNAIALCFYPNNNYIDHIDILHGNGTKAINVYAKSAGNVVTLYYYTTGWVQVTAIGTVNGFAWHLIEFENIDWSAGTYDILFNGAMVKSGAAMQTTAAQENTVFIQQDAGSSDRDVYIDSLAVRSYVDVEPVIGTWGEEEEIVYNTGDGPAGVKTWNDVPSANIKAWNDIPWNTIKAMN